MPGDGRHLPQAGGEAHAVFLLLSELVLVELPDAAVLLEQRAGILALATSAVRSGCWQAFDGAPTLTYSEPLPSNAMPLSPCCALAGQIR